MREILIRGKRKDNSEWVEGDLIQLHDGRKYIINNVHGACFDEKGNFVNTEEPFVCHVDPATVGLYTSLTDKNGQKIFEGDYIQAVLPARKAQREFTWPVMPVVYSRGAFGLADSRGEVTPLRSFAPYVTFEVIGNVHDAEYRSDTQQEATEQ